MGASPRVIGELDVFSSWKNFGENVYGVRTIRAGRKSSPNMRERLTRKMWHEKAIGGAKVQQPRAA